MKLKASEICDIIKGNLIGDSNIIVSDIEGLTLKVFKPDNDDKM